ncbi:MAG TPA: NAD(P)-dependent oxidoreductase, partial [Dehalococcoidia bacterium]|nr:NAD(P)-dependent oxidoreductase [Dehalococcoidia bacterium]
AGIRLDDPGAGARLAETEVIATALTSVDRAVIEAAPNLRLVQAFGIGVNRHDVLALAERGILIANTEGSNSVSTAEHGFMLALVLSRQFLRPYLDLKQQGAWRGAGEEAWELAGKTMAILGYGNIGRAVGRMARGFDMRVIAWNRRADQPRPPEDGVHFYPLEALLPEADVLYIALPLSRQSRGLIGAEQLALLKPSAILINVGRGPIVDEVALIDAVDSGRLAGAGLDVTTQEPLPPDSPLLKVDRIVVTPHYGGGSRDSLARMRRYVVENVVRYLRGETPEHLVSADLA